MNTIVIDSKRKFKLDFKEFWIYRELLYFFAWRDLKVRYKQTVLGVLWAILQPFVTMFVFTIFFGRVAGINSGDIPYPIFVYTGLLFWTFFSGSLSGISSSLLGGQNLIQKVYFPRLILPLSSTIVYFVDFLLATVIFAALMVYYGFVPTFLGIILVIPCLVITFLSFSGLGLMLAAINVKYRDVRYALPFFLQLLIFITPVIYPTSILGRYQWLWYLNPMSGVIETMRAGLLGTGAINWSLLGTSALIGIVLFFAGIIYFRRTEMFFADLI
ncbi:MAG: phosphate ABC transporter permease [Candidatus Nealsonbacteria bacterium RIFOXYB1_FULL_40_15]|uniref:Transport permease protein n=2 Tax=Candidatus Nealsoniibacteriota TaxID=1817911 RepID=A0A1G2ETD7_9BACT|nr:MAG: phosphate ABC transporter permease [Candidatus Nealsonbacteria bacterium RIFOXYB1_FULL_40_15]OGZ28782.1 MAG: phosphate ABC transporter permease [Candidatus Nealsonbacteria bacterium RIFOXYC1_FULL_40_7]OGZ29059.1 MAG: phosphate ABC transporter permease [Candidatus Nealsonbacteria bacterium RIFOXYD1_FULL_39_11]